MRETHDYLILGGGPAGLQLGYYLGKRKQDYLILERDNCPGAFFKMFPRHGQLISINKVHTGTDDPQANLRWDWNSLLCDNPALLFKEYSTRYFPPSEDLVRYLKDFADHYSLNIRFNTHVIRVSRPDGIFRLEDREGREYFGKRLIIATGLSKPYIPDFPGAELCENYVNHSIDPQDYVNQRVLIVGKGNSAFETADNLIETASTIHILSPESVRMAWQTHFVGNLRAVNNNFLDTYQLKAQNAVIDGEVSRVEAQDGRLLVHLVYSHAMSQTALIPYDRVILCTGFIMDSSIFDESCRPELVIDGKVPAQTGEWESKNIDDLYFAGTLMQACDYKRTMSGFIHGFRHNIETLSNILDQKYHGKEWPREELKLDADAILHRVISQVNTSPGIFLQPGFLCDVVVIRSSEGMAEYYTDLRRDFVPHSWLGRNEHYYTVSLEYGHFAGDPFSVERDPSPEMAHEAAYLHPVIRRFNAGELVAEHHINDDLESQWHKEVYVNPARAFLTEQLSPVSGQMGA